MPTLVLVTPDALATLVEAAEGGNADAAELASYVAMSEREIREGKTACINCHRPIRTTYGVAHCAVMEPGFATRACVCECCAATRSRPELMAIAEASFSAHAAMEEAAMQRGGRLHDAIGHA